MTKTFRFEYMPIIDDFWIRYLKWNPMDSQTISVLAIRTLPKNHNSACWTQSAAECFVRTPPLLLCE